jgi:hypothetical protein
MTFLDRAEQFLRYAGPVVDAALGGPERRASAAQQAQAQAGPAQQARPAAQATTIGQAWQKGQKGQYGQAADEPPLPGAEALLDGIPPELVLRVLPDVARSAAAVAWRTSVWTLNATLRAGNIVIQGTISGQSADAMAIALLGEVRQSLFGSVGLGAWVEGPNGWGGQGMTLAEQMGALLDASADVSEAEGGTHPAYVRLLSELTPDEARILRLFAQRGPQPAVDVRTRKLLGGGSRLVAPGLTMISRYAGCRNAVRVPGYLENMSRLGLIRFSDDPVADPGAYDVLEAQEEVKGALSTAGRGMTVRRRIELTVFGRNLCAMTGLLPASAAAPPDPAAPPSPAV